MANRFNDREREERNYYTSRGRDREQQGGPQDWREFQNQEGREWYETEQPEWQGGGQDYESGRFRGSSGEGRGMRSSFSGQGSQERYGRQEFGRGGQGQFGRGSEREEHGSYAQRGGGESFGQGRQSFGQGQRSQHGQHFENYGQENWRTQRERSQEGRFGQQYGSGQSGEYGFGQRGQSGSQGGQYGYGQRGQFSGRGPKGYRRSDERIQEDINERLTQDPDIDAWEIEVQVQSGEVILTGTVDDRQTKHRVEDIAEAVSGVKDVQNQIRVKKGDEDQSSEFKKGSTYSSELSDKDKSGQGGIKANIK
jgi:osmotically-inducible protein OsmY